LTGLTDSIRAKYFKRVFEAIDGLWFMKTEDESDFKKALEIDRKVWEIVPKIQARELKSLVGIENNGLMALMQALELKAELEQALATFETDNENCLQCKITSCPWFELMKKSGREHLAGRVGEVICGTEYPVWMKEFNVQGNFSLKKQLCNGDDCCLLEFSTEPT